MANEFYQPCLYFIRYNSFNPLPRDHHDRIIVIHSIKNNAIVVTIKTFFFNDKFNINYNILLYTLRTVKYITLKYMI